MSIDIFGESKSDNDNNKGLHSVVKREITEVRQDLFEELRRLKNVGLPYAPSDAVNLEYLQSNRITMVDLTGKLVKRQKSFFKIIHTNLSYFKFLYEGTVIYFKSDPQKDFIEVDINNKIVDHFQPFNFQEGDKISFQPKPRTMQEEGTLLHVNMSILFHCI